MDETTGGGPPLLDMTRFDVAFLNFCLQYFDSKPQPGSVKPPKPVTLKNPNPSGELVIAICKLLGSVDATAAEDLS